MPKRRTGLTEKWKVNRALVKSSLITSVGTPLTTTLRERLGDKCKYMEFCLDSDEGLLD